MESIIQPNNRWCYICGCPYNTEMHHVFNKYDKKKSEKYGLLVYLCDEYHRGTHGVHGKNGSELNKAIKMAAQRRFEEEYPELDFLQIFGRNYL